MVSLKGERVQCCSWELSGVFFWVSEKQSVASKKDWGELPGRVIDVSA
jgi:hypothetical protein